MYTNRYIMLLPYFHDGEHVLNRSFYAYWLARLIRLLNLYGYIWTYFPNAPKFAA